MTSMKYGQKHFWREHVCALQVFLCALVSQTVCACTRAQLRRNIQHTLKNIWGARFRFWGSFPLTLVLFFHLFSGFYNRNGFIWGSEPLKYAHAHIYNCLKC